MGWRKGKRLAEEFVKFLWDATCVELESGSRMAVGELKFEDFAVRSLCVRDFIAHMSLFLDHLRSTRYDDCVFGRLEGDMQRLAKTMPHRPQSPLPSNSV